MRPSSPDWEARIFPAEYDAALKRRQERIEARLLIKPAVWTTIQSRLKHYRRSKEPRPSDARWTIAMVLAWIMWGNNGYVREYASREKANRLRMLLEWSNDVISGVWTQTDLESATQKFFNAAIAGHLKFRALSEETGRAQDIDPADWQYISRTSDNCNVLIWEKRRTVAFSNPTCSAESVLELWPEPKARYRSVSKTLHSSKPINERERIIRAVASSEMSPDQAEALALEKGFAPFSELPDPSSFRHMQEAFWPIELAVAWGIWGSTDKVAQHYSTYRQKCFVWIPVIKPGMFLSMSHHLEAMSESSLKTVQDDFEYYQQVTSREEGGKPSLLTFNEAFEDVKRALLSGELIAYAINLETLKPTSIPRVDWEYLQPVHEEDGSTTFKSQLSSSSLYAKVKVDRSRALAIWERERETEVAAVSESRQLAPSVDGNRTASIADRISAAGLSTLTPTEELIWRAINAIGGESALPNRRLDYIKMIRANVNGTMPSPASIDRFFGKFGPPDYQD